MGIGEYFLDSLFADIDGFLLHAGAHERYLDYHRMLAKRFPFAIYYRLSGNEIQVWRILDCRRSPLRLKRALQAKEKRIK